MRPQLTLLASLPVLVACSSRAIIHVSAGRSNLTLHAHVVKGAAVLPLTKAPLGLLLASDDACTSIVKPTWRRPFAVFARSGGCPLEAKVRTASIAGASALIVADTLTTLYEPLSNDTAASMSLRDPCAVHCDAGRGTIDTGTVNIASVLRGLPGRCPAPDSYIGKRCPTELCAFSRAASTSSASREVCCVLESRAPEPSLTVGNRSLPVLTLSLSLSEVLEGTCATSACTTSTCAVPACTLAVAAQAEPPVGVGAWDGSALIMWALAVGTAALASFLAASENHQQDAELLAEEAGGGRSPGAAALAAATIDASTALSFLVMASAGLLALYFAIQAGFDGVILVINVLFIFATATATAQVLLVPSLVACSSPSIRGATVGLPAWLASALSLGGAPSSTPSSEVDNDTAGGATANTVGEGASVPLLPLLGTVLAFALSISWFLLRKQPWMWLLQDALSMMVCVLFVRTIRLPSLKLAALFLGLMFFYDIFMVFISPLVFHKSVMLEVALAGQSTHSVGALGECVRTEGENMPMLMAIPRTSAYVSVYEGVYSPARPSPLVSPTDAPHGVGSLLWRLSGAPGDFGMIGLGDIVLPSLAIAYGRRIDLASAAASGQTPSRCGYFLFAVLGYAVGLIVTQAANAYGWTFNGVQGQPALLYLVPGVIGFQLLRALLARDLEAVWEGSALPQPPANLSSLGCDGCGNGMLLDDHVWSDESRNVDYCPSCYVALPEGKQAALVEMPVYRRCKVDPPTVITRTYPPGGSRDPTLL